MCHRGSARTVLQLERAREKAERVEGAEARALGDPVCRVRVGPPGWGCRARVDWCTHAQSDSESEADKFEGSRRQGFLPRAANKYISSLADIYESVV